MTVQAHIWASHDQSLLTSYQIAKITCQSCTLSRKGGISSRSPSWYWIVSPNGSLPRLTESIRPMCICRYLSLRKRNMHGKTMTAHVESKVN